MQMIVMTRIRSNAADSGIIEENYSHRENRVAIDAIDKLLRKRTRISRIGERQRQLAPVGSEWTYVCFQPLLMCAMSRSWTTTQQTEIAKPDTWSIRMASLPLCRDRLERVDYFRYRIAVITRWTVETSARISRIVSVEAGT